MTNKIALILVIVVLALMALTAVLTVKTTDFPTFLRTFGVFTGAWLTISS